MADFRHSIIDGLRELCKHWEVTLIHKGLHNGKKVTSIYLEHCIVSIFTEDNGETEINVDAFIQLLIQGKILSFPDMFVTDFWKDM